MLNYIWAGMILIGIAFGAVNGTLAEAGTQAFDSAKEAVTLSLTMLGTMALWCGLLEVAKKSGMLSSMTRGIQPVVRWLFPRLPKGHPAGEYIAVNMIANFLGLGSAATPAGLKAMQSLEQLEEERRKNGDKAVGRQLPARARGTASNEMCTFLIINISSLQLIPVNMIAYRSQYGSVSPTSIVGPAIATTAISTAAAILFCKMADRKKRGA
ncbi:MAG: nucleoside recognition domain-containing protein [Lachnospiraceae bacterium]